MILLSVLSVVGALLVVGGTQLTILGGSLYYLLAGIGILVTAVFLWWRRSAAAWLYASISAGTVLWALAESGLYFWALFPRIFLPALLGLWFGLPSVQRSLGTRAPLGMAGPLIFVLSLALLASSFIAGEFRPAAHPRSFGHVADQQNGNEWRYFGGDAGGTRFAASSQVNRDNVRKLILAWSYRTGDDALRSGDTSGYTFESTPIYAGGALYVCTAHDVLISLDPDTGRQLWRFDPKIGTDRGSTARRSQELVCRGPAYHEDVGREGPCAKRLIMGTMDNRLFGIDAETGHPCRDFGVDGVVDLSVGMGALPPGYYGVTSPPTILGDIAVVGHTQLSNQSTVQPSGVTRAYDVHSGRLMWAWDGLSATGSAQLKPDEGYAPNSPNVWAVGSADSSLDLVYLPTGVGPTDFVDTYRTDKEDRYADSIVAIEAGTGNVRWSFQTVHHDLWDFDVGAQPTLVSFPTPTGDVPAVIASTKAGEIFVLDRRTGQPLTGVVEKSVPITTDAIGEKVSPTQPFAVDFPSLAPPDLTEASMWGATPLDQLLCRIKFRRSLYKGSFTPPSVQGSISYPGPFGAVNWGGVAVDLDRRILVANFNWSPWLTQLIPRIDADRLGIKPFGVDSQAGAPPTSQAASWGFAQRGAAYAARVQPFLSRLRIPCNQPPWGGLAAIDLATRKVLWQRPLGTTRDVAPLGIALPTGVFNLGGSVVTRGALIFIAATVDNYLRAFDTETGEELWKARLPAGGQANPLTFVSQHTGRQYIVIAAGGRDGLRTQLGDYVLAFALPN